MKISIASFRIAVATLLICVVGYSLMILGIAALASPETAQGSLVTGPSGGILGSRLIAQRFQRPEYFWPRPSACDYNAAGAGGSNKSPTSPDLTKRARGTVARHDATPARPLPADLAAASGAGLDPHITVGAARYQAQRIATARGLARPAIEVLIDRHTFSPGGIFTAVSLVNVLELNLALDRQPTVATTQR
jgi:K+-transporting ATPase ATPase C chain